MEVELTAPNGKKWTQPLGLFINNEFVKSKNEQKLASINPTYVSYLTSPTHITPSLTKPPVPKRRFARYTPQPPRMSTPQ